MRYHVYWVYILSSANGVLYIGVTNSLARRLLEHRKPNAGYSGRYLCHQLVYYEKHQYINNAIKRETELKTWRREKKIQLIHSFNPGWKDLGYLFSLSISPHPSK